MTTPRQSTFIEMATAAPTAPDPTRLSNNNSSYVQPFLWRKTLAPTSPFGISAEQWRYIIARAPVVAVCIRTLVLQLTAIPWKLMGDDPKEAEYYTDVLNNANDETFDTFIERLVQDVLTVPFGGAMEAVRYRSGGELAKIYHVDGGSLFPTYDPDHPFVQVDPDNSQRYVTFTKEQISRMKWAPMSDMRNYEWTKPPVMEVFSAVEALMRSDVFYSQFLSNTPEAGILDLMDMDERSAKEWVKSWQELMLGIDPMKVPVLYAHSTEAKFIPFSRSPGELTLPELVKRYAEVVCAAFGMNIGDLGLFEHTNTLAGSSRQQAMSKRQGLPSLMRKFKNFISGVFPKTVHFEWDVLDEDDRLRKEQSKLARANTLRILATPIDPTTGEAIFPLDIIRKQAILDDLINVIDINDVDLASIGITPAPSTPTDASKVPDQSQIAVGDPGSNQPVVRFNPGAVTYADPTPLEDGFAVTHPEQQPVVQKFNPNHSPDSGEFTGGSGGNAKVVVSPLEQPPSPEVGKKQSARFERAAPNTIVSVYGGVPAHAKEEIVSGQLVTPNANLAWTFGENAAGSGNSKVIEIKAPRSHFSKSAMASNDSGLYEVPSGMQTYLYQPPQRTDVLYEQHSDDHSLNHHQQSSEQQRLLPVEGAEIILRADPTSSYPEDAPYARHLASTLNESFTESRKRILKSEIRKLVDKILLEQRFNPNHDPQ